LHRPRNNGLVFPWYAPKKKDLFCFEERQSTFVLDVDKPALASPAERSSQPAARTLRLPANLTAAAVNPENGDVAF